MSLRKARVVIVNADMVSGLKFTFECRPFQRFVEVACGWCDTLGAKLAKERQLA